MGEAMGELSVGAGDRHGGCRRLLVVRLSQDGDCLSLTREGEGVMARVGGLAMEVFSCNGEVLSPFLLVWTFR